MEVLQRIDAIRARCAGWRAAGHSIGLVPTMGSVHAGHLSLVRIAQAQADRVVVTLFVNPLQFGAGEDFAGYPRDLERDQRLLAEAGAELLFAPEVPEMYPDGSARTTLIDVPELSAVLEGRFRPGHFAGVATVVVKLLNIVQPDVAVFGEKDFQQLVLVRRLVRDLCLPVRVMSGAIVRDADGLALSSRNAYLAPEQRALAPLLYRELEEAARRIRRGEKGWNAIEQDALRSLAGAGFAPDYFAIRRSLDLHEPAAADRDLVILVAARIGTTRLIDNLRVALLN